MTAPINKHTPGPWLIFESGNHNFLDEKSVVIADSSGIQIAAACTGTSEEQANARLIAAAPDLLAALEKVRHFVVSSHEPVGYELDEIDAAIAKAKGGAA